ncbi:hypothetical protein BX600DRAFT_106159 [Xylariales sp. PMI_506]|nr:hypothetical protein BX600DRAFT_106159 [Xylariales sp. PMI_506]
MRRKWRLVDLASGALYPCRAGLMFPADFPRDARRTNWKRKRWGKMLELRLSRGPPSSIGRGGTRCRLLIDPRASSVLVWLLFDVEIMHVKSGLWKRGRGKVSAALWITAAKPASHQTKSPWKNPEVKKKKQSPSIGELLSGFVARDPTESDSDSRI